MKFYHPETESLLWRLVKQSGVAMAPSNPDVWGAVKKWLGVFSRIFVYTIILLSSMGVRNSEVASPEWHMLVAGVIMISHSWLLSGHLDAFASPSSRVLMQLPVPGQQVVRWVHHQALRYSLWPAFWAFVVAFGMSGLDLSLAGALVQTVLLWAVMLATASLGTNPYFVRTRLPMVFLVAAAGAVVVGGCMLFNPAKEQGAMPGWILEASSVLSAFLPGSWVHPARIGGWGGVLALVWVLLGGWWWLRRPAIYGAVLDQPLELGSADPEAQAKDLEMVAENEAVAADAEAIPIPALCDQGWIERLAWRFLSPRDRALAAALVPAQPGWTKRWNKAVWYCAAGLMLAVLHRVLGPMLPDPWRNLSPLLIWALPAWGIGVVAWPISNMIPLATSAWALGYLNIPFFAGLPVGVKELTRLSTRLTTVRSLPVALLGIPVCCLLLFITGRSEDMLVLLRLIPGMLVVWIFIRPILIWYRVQLLVRPRRGARLGYLLCNVVTATLNVVAVSSAALGLIQLVTVQTAKDGWKSWYYVIVELAVACICARLAFWLFHWQLKAGKIDLIQRGKS